jgi:hypothetical protein
LHLTYKPDWEDTKQRLLAWWQHELTDRCVVSVTAPREGLPPEAPPALPERVDDRWLQPDYLHALNEYIMRHTFYGGEAFPVWNAGYPGWDFIPSYLGSRITLKEDTGWVDPLIDAGELTDHDYRKLTIKPESHWWMVAQAMLRFAVSEARGKSLPGILAFGGCGDTLAALRSTNKLLFDVLDCPDYVREFDQYLMRQWMEVYDVFYDLTHEGAEGATCWFPLWSPGKFYPAHNDFSYMISPRMYERIFLPSIEMQTHFLDHTVYHVDGIGAFAHVPALCLLPRLQAFQILPGDGKPSALHYMKVLRQVQAAGKNLFISLPFDEVETALSELSSRGLCIQTTAPSEAQARQLLKDVAKWTHD